MRMSDADWLTSERPCHKPDWRLRRAVEQVRMLFTWPDVWTCVIEPANELIRLQPKSPCEGHVAAAKEQLDAEITAMPRSTSCDRDPVSLTA